jgi:hypothetical protein
MDGSTLHRLTLLVIGIIHGKSASPARIASALHTLGLSQARSDSIERQIRRLENDPEVDAAVCFHPLARVRLRWGQPKVLQLILDPTTQEDRVVMVSVAVWYRGRALPLAWTTWPGNLPLVGKGFWERIEALLEQVKPLLPVGTQIIWFADRAFGTPMFIDLIVRSGWHYVVRVQGQTHYRDRLGREGTIQELLRKGKRAKMLGEVFKKAGWRPNSVVVYWGKAHKSPLCLVSDLPADWSLIALYRRRYPIEASFRDYKSYGWRWEQGQVSDPEHLERLLVGMALATWIALFIGSHVAEEVLHRYRSSHRYTRPYEGKRSLFTLGLERFETWLSSTTVPRLPWSLFRWSAPNWEDQLYFLVARNYVFA